MIVLRLGASGSMVRDWQHQLCLLGHSVVEDGAFGPHTVSATKEFQHLAGLLEDGEVGDETRAAAAARLPHVQPGPFATALVAAAVSQLGVSEQPPGSNQGPDLLKFWQATDYPDGMDNREPWCSAFQCWVVQWAMQHATQPPAGLTKDTRPTTAAVKGWIPWAMQHSDFVTVLSPSVAVPRPGDIVVYIFSHVGIVESYNSQRVPSLSCIEGNSNSDGSAEGYEVVRHRRTIAQCRAFIRFAEGVA